MFAQLFTLSVYTSALVSAAPSLQAPMQASCGLDMQASLPIHTLEAGTYTIYNSVTGSDRLASFNAGAPVVVLPGKVPSAYVTWEVTPVPWSDRQYYIINTGTHAGGALDENDIVITDRGLGNPFTLISRGRHKFMEEEEEED
ncbi:hypothetical protein K438DRAFT_867717 [Mycena galopus ATCC 62051]|nr:hypothetical protein K438DRAFT_867717 [Mycena galopus ATCC 62051]